jgi:hypothetical protein
VVVGGGEKQNPVVKFPQILGAALSANVFVIIAQSVANLKSYELVSTAFICLIFLWNLKDGIDDFKSYETQKVEGFSLAPTVTFRVISYMLLVVAVMNIDNLERLIFAMVAYFVTFIVWSLNSIQRRLVLKSNSFENTERLSRRYRWLGLYGFCVLCCLLFLAKIPILNLIAILLLLIMFVDDSQHCETFDNKINETL